MSRIHQAPCDSDGTLPDQTRRARKGVGLFEGRMAEYSRKHGIEEARTPLGSSMGKMSGCLLGVGMVSTMAWSLLGLGT